MKQGTGDYSVFVGNLPFTITASELVAFAATFGRTAGCNIPVDRTSNKSLGYGFVYTKYASDAARIAQRLRAGRSQTTRQHRTSAGVACVTSGRIAGRETRSPVFVRKAAGRFVLTAYPAPVSADGA